jgi:diaminohydroxyphosphoribosylaminopyrimidine deaminase/5-amino-6-(5-phosphoribosylamino)uracil reductase
MQKVDEHFMALALKEAEKGRGHVHPNPLVGAVLVDGQRVVARGAHRVFGGPHAEVDALRRLKKSPEGLTLYTTLEPCSHFGKTPPCADLLIAKRIGRVVIGARDPNPRVAGKGIRRLKSAGVRVTLGVRRRETERLNRDFRQWVLKKTPYVVVKVALSRDSRLAAAPGRPRWITGVPARRFSHGLRACADAILVGVHTVLQDDPRLNVRLAGAKRHPMKVILDPTLRTPLSARIFSKQSPAPVLIFTAKDAPIARLRALRKKAKVVVVPEKRKGRLDWKSVLRALGRRGVVNLLIEGGGEILASALSAKIVHEAYVFTSPRNVGVSGVKSPESVRRLSDRAAFRRSERTRVGRDRLLHGVF